MEGSREVTGGGPVISSAVRKAVAQFELEVKSELEVANDQVLIKHMRDYALAKIFTMIIDGKEDVEVVEYLQRAAQSFKSQRQQKTGNPIRVFRRLH